MIVVECDSCKDRRLCPMKARAERHRAALRAFAYQVDRDDCPHYTPAWHHGVEGVYPSPHPSCVLGASERR